MKILGICSSIRARFNNIDKALQTINEIDNYHDFYTILYENISNKSLSNSEALLWMALFGAKGSETNIDLVLLKNIKDTIDIKNMVSDADGIILSTPVYFGDRSSLSNALMCDCDLNNKVFASLSVGAKRNGGQETTNIFSLWDALNSGAMIVGNGPPTSQYGGTGWAGNIGSILDDNFGFDTSLGTGKRVAEIINITTKIPHSFPAKIALIHVSSGTNHGILSEIETILYQLGAETILIDLKKYNIHPCLGCSQCPNSNEEPICIVNDDMQTLRDYLRNSHGFIFITDCLIKDQYWFLFQRFAERTRCLRRNHFELSNRPAFIVNLQDMSMNSILPLRTISFILRHNCFVIGPVYSIYHYHEKLIYSEEQIKKHLKSFVTMGAKISYILTNHEKTRYEYIPVGYKRK